MPKLRVIYEPQGMAGEYGTLACTLFVGCKGNCAYCFNIRPGRRTREQFTASTEPRKDIIKKLRMDLDQLFREHKLVDQTLFLSFGCDPYPEEYSEVTREAIELCMKYDVGVRILTKAPNRSRRDWDLFLQHGVELGVTFSCSVEAARRDWEPNAESIPDRFLTLDDAHEQGIYTWVSLEPVITMLDTIALIRAFALAGCVDEVRFGMLNHIENIKREFPELVERYRVEHIDWSEFAVDAVEALQEYPGWKWHMKQGLAKHAPPGTPASSE